MCFIYMFIPSIVAGGCPGCHSHTGLHPSRKLLDSCGRKSGIIYSEEDMKVVVLKSHLGRFYPVMDKKCEFQNHFVLLKAEQTVGPIVGHSDLVSLLS